MKLLASLIIAASLVLGTVTASTAYIVSLDRPDEELHGLTLNAPAGIVMIDEERVARRLLGNAWMRFRQVDRFERTVDEVIERELANGEDPGNLHRPPPPDDALIAQLKQRGQSYDLFVYQAIVKANMTREMTPRVLVPGTPLARPNGARIPLLAPNTKLDEDALSALRKFQSIVAGTEYERDTVTVKEFSFGRWQHRWWFVLACVGLFVGAMMMRMASRRALEASLQATHGAEESPFEAIDRAHQELCELREALQSMSEPMQQTRRMVKDIQQVQNTHLAAFVQSRDAIIGRLGLGGYAQVMDVFASAERQVNRAWSAAADHVLVEALDCLELGIVRLEEASVVLRRLVSATQR